MASIKKKRKSNKYKSGVKEMEFEVNSWLTLGRKRRLHPMTESLYGVKT